MLVPSHFVPLAAPGMVALGLKWMWNPASPFYVKPRLSRDLLDWGIKFWRAATPEHVRRAAPLLRDLSIASHRCFEELAALPGSDFGLVRKGLLMLCRTPHALDEEVRTAELGRALGIAAEVLDARQVAALDPGIRMDIAGAVYFPQDCHLSPGSLRGASCRTGSRRRASSSPGTPRVTGWRVEGGRHDPRRDDARRPRDRGGRIRALRRLVVAAARARARACACRCRPAKATASRCAKPRQLPAICAILTEARVAVTPMGGALRFAGTMEIAGLNEDINPVRVRGIIARRDEVLSRVRAVGFRRRRAVARAAAVLAGRHALPRPHREMRESLHRHRPRDDGHEPRPGHRAS